MRHFFIFICAFLMLAPHAWAQSFFNSLPDIPLMSGLVEMDDRALSFDKPEGRIVVGAAAIGQEIDDSQLLSYYQRALPQFGWHGVTPYSYMRGSETLVISIEEHAQEGGAEKILEITISP